MKKINLREVYPFYENDCFIMVDDVIAEIFEESKRKELNYQRKIYRNGAHFSLDRDDGIELDAIFISLSPYEIYERKPALVRSIQRTRIKYSSRTAFRHS